MVRWIAVALLVLVAVLGFVAWRRSVAPAPAASAPQSSAMPLADEPSAGEPPAAAPPSRTSTTTGGPGVNWTVPAAWGAGPPRPMRLATYAVGDAECAVFYFGPNQGGGVDDNIDRWAGQFQGSPNPKRAELTVRGMKVTRVEINGDYLSPGTDMQSQGKQPQWRLLGAIVQGPPAPGFVTLTVRFATWLL